MVVSAKFGENKGKDKDRDGNDREGPGPHQALFYHPPMSHSHTTCLTIDRPTFRLPSLTLGWFCHSNRRCTKPNRLIEKIFKSGQ